MREQATADVSVVVWLQLVSRTGFMLDGLSAAIPSPTVMRTDGFHVRVAHHPMLRMNVTTAVTSRADGASATRLPGEKRTHSLREIPEWPAALPGLLATCHEIAFLDAQMRS
jgi:hypothetical protein